MRIPRRFKLLGQTIEVEFIDDLVHDNDALGGARFRANKIVLQASTEGYPRLQSHIEVSFLHEVVHWILHAMQWGRGSEEGRLSDDEKFAALFANCLHQVLTTMEYDDDES